MRKPGFVYIEAGDSFEQDALADFFAGALENGLQDAMDLDPDPSEPRMQVDEVRITQVDLSADRRVVFIQYEYDASCYYGCRDQDYADTLEGDITGHLEDGFWVFPRYVPPERLAPNEEF